jgi:signal recognition particle subunit SRP54
MGGMQGLLGMLPGVGKIKQQIAAAGLDDSLLKRQEAVISSMTKVERVKPDVINASRRKRIAAGAGVQVSDVNKVLKMQRQMADAMKRMGKLGKKGLPFGIGGVDPSMLSGMGGLPPGFPRK